MTLTELSVNLRRFLPFAVIFFLVILIIYYLFKLLFIYLDLNKPKPITINAVFGKIQSPQLEKVIKNRRFSYVFDTIEGEPVSASETAKVYFIPEAMTRFGYREKIYLMAKNLGFDTATIKHKLVGKEASFTDEKQQLTIDITNFNFSYQYQFNGSEEFFLNNYLPFGSQIEEKAVDFLKTMDRYPAELARGKKNLIYLNFDPATKNLSIVDNPNIANLVEVDFYRPDIDIFPIVSPSYFNTQNVVVLVFYGQREFKILKAQIKFFEKSEEQIGVYPVKSGQLAWEDLKAGRGIIVSAPQNSDEVVIKNMFFAYFDPDIYQPYLQPVYVFLGTGNFVGYVPAVIEKYLLE